MLKLLAILALAALVCRVLTRRWPWQLLSGSTRNAALGRARVLLGVPPKATRQQIIEAHRQLIAMVHPDRGGTNEQVHEANAARDLLLGALQTEKLE